MVTPRPLSSLQNSSFVHVLLQSHPCCPAPHYQCQRILIWLRMTKPLYYQDKENVLPFIQAAAFNISSQTVNLMQNLMNFSFVNHISCQRKYQDCKFRNASLINGAPLMRRLDSGWYEEKKKMSSTFVTDVPFKRLLQEQNTQTKQKWNKRSMRTSWCLKKYIAVRNGRLPHWLHNLDAPDAIGFRWHPAASWAYDDIIAYTVCLDGAIWDRTQRSRSQRKIRRNIPTSKILLISCPLLWQPFLSLLPS